MPRPLIPGREDRTDLPCVVTREPPAYPSETPNGAEDSVKAGTMTRRDQGSNRV